MKLIREGRFGLPKSFKTGGVVGTYPKPMLVILFEPAELDVIPSKGAPSGDIALDVTAQDIVRIKPHELEAYAIGKLALPPVLAVDFGPTSGTFDPLDMNYKPRQNAEPFTAFIKWSNYLCRLGKAEGFPWKTVVFDNLSDFSDIILQSISALQSAAMNDARQWASMVGSKILQVITAYHDLPCHTVFIMHSQQDKNELTGQISEVPKIYSGVRDVVGKLFSSFLYATKQGGKPVVYTTDQGLVRGIGVRWPQGLPAVCQPDYRSIYGRELEK